MRVFYIIILALLVVGCANTSLQITSEPSEADVTYIVNNLEQKLGVTPLNLTKDQMGEVSSKGFKVRFEKPGFLKEQITLDSTYFKKVGSMNVKLTPKANWKEASQDPQANRYLNDVASLSAEIQALTVKKEFPQAETLVKSLVTRYPKLSVGWTLMGNIYYLQRRVGDAITAYQKALELNPEDQEIKNILNQIRGAAL